MFLQLKKQDRRIVSLLMSFILVLLLNNGVQSSPQTGTQILWDTYGIPHIYGENTKSLFYAFGWAQMQSHGNLILRLYGQARGQAAEFWGEDYLESDRWVQTMGIPNRAKAWYESQTPIFRNYLDAFVGGMNAYAKEHPEALTEELKVALPLKPADVLAHEQRVINFTFVVDPERVENLTENHTPKGSNGWAIAPSHSQSGNAMLLANPHLPWSDLYLWYEAQLVAPEINAYGATLVGFPVLTIAFNDNLGWTHTVNTHDGWDAYELPLANDGYRFDGEVRSFDREEKVLKVKEKNGNLRSESLVVRRSVHGPILTEKQGKAIALRVVGLDKPAALQQWWDMARARNFNEFEAVLKRLEIPMFTVMYADREGHIMHLFNGQVPIRKNGDFKYWSDTIPGDTSETLWSKNHPYADLPRVVDPPSGWLQNTNDPPWTTTFPSAIAPNNYPAYMAPRGPMDLRSQRSAKMLLEDEKISFDELMQYKHSTQVELADRLLDDLIPVARQGSEKARRAAEVLATWNRKVDADSRGAVLFAFWKKAMDADKLFAKPWSEDAPLTTPDGLANPAEAVRVLEATATKVEATYGALDVAWGEVFRLPGEANLPANGGDGDLGVFRSVWFAPGKDNRFQAVAGDSFVAAIEFSNPVKAMALNSYGNATQPGSPHVGDQLQLFARKELRPVWRSRSEIEAHLSSRQKL
ncbi:MULTISPECIES: acylase [unclassified Microcoleus]|uniref:acylase n=2 Tax=unclassified Microcoleus TaxID=2642155 RepID=UPI002FD1A77B